MAFASADVNEEDIAVGGVEAVHEAFGDRVEVWLEPHCITSTIRLHEVVEIARLRGVCSQPWEEVQRGLHTDLERARNSRGFFIRHSIEVLRQSIEGLSCGVVAEKDAVLEVRSGELVAQKRCEPDSRAKHIDHRAGFEVAKDALELVLVVRGLDGEGIACHARGASVT